MATTTGEAESNNARVDDLAALGLPPDAVEHDIRAAYRAKALNHHPDLGGDAHVMAEISDAYQRLVDPEPPLLPHAAAQRRTTDQSEAPDDFTIGHSMLAFVVVPIILAIILMLGVFSVLTTIL